MRSILEFLAAMRNGAHQTYRSACFACRGRVLYRHCTMSGDKWPSKVDNGELRLSGATYQSIREYSRGMKGWQHQMETVEEVIYGAGKCGRQSLGGTKRWLPAIRPGGKEVSALAAFTSRAKCRTPHGGEKMPAISTHSVGAAYPCVLPLVRNEKSMRSYLAGMARRRLLIGAKPRGSNKEIA